MTYLSKDEMSGLGLSRADIAAPSAIATKKDNRGRVIFMVRHCQRHNVSVTGLRVATTAIQATGPHSKKRTRAAPVHAELCCAVE